jgi:uncharacterized protein involved in exopolysaccharide biosynthesis
MAEETVTLELLGRLVPDMQAEMRDLRAEFRSEMARFRDQMTVQTSILLRRETAQNSMAEQLRAMVRQHQRTHQRLRAFEEDRH